LRPSFSETPERVPRASTLSARMDCGLASGGSAMAWSPDRATTASSAGSPGSGSAAPSSPTIATATSSPIMVPAAAPPSPEAVREPARRAPPALSPVSSNGPVGSATAQPACGAEMIPHQSSLALTPARSADDATVPAAPHATCPSWKVEASTTGGGMSSGSHLEDVESVVSSLTSECECPICYRTFCEPVRAGCDRHIFCRQCLWRAEKVGEPLKCPICRRLGNQIAVANLAEVVDLAAKLRSRDPTEYDSRAEAARREREITVRSRSDARALFQELVSRPDDPRRFEVSGAGCEESNGVYVVDVLPTYLGPPVYRKPNTFFFIFRWHRTQWVIAELRDYSRMGNSRAWLYAAPTQVPPHLPPATGWEVQRRSGAPAPAPEVWLLARDATSLPGRGNGNGSGMNPMAMPSTTAANVLGATTLASSQSPPSATAERQDRGSAGANDQNSPNAAGVSSEMVVSGPVPRCRCGPPCSIM